MKRAILSILAFVLPCCLLFAGNQDRSITRLTTDDGLSNSSVNCIFQDESGRMWFGTWDGLDMYDSRYVRVFKPDPSNPASISHNVIRSIDQQRPGILWISTDKGINRMDVRSFSFSHWFTDLEISSENAFSTAVSPDGTVYAIVDGYGCYRFDESSGQFRFLFPYGQCSAAFFDSQSALWILSVDGLLERYTVGDSSEEHHASVVDRDVCSAAIDRGGNRVAIHYRNNSLVVLDIFAQTRVPLLRTEHLNALSIVENVVLYADVRGLYAIDLDSRERVPLAVDDRIMCICPGIQGVLWVGTDMHGLVRIVDKHNADFTSYPDDGGNLFGSNALRSFCKLDDGSLLVGTKGSGIYSFAVKDDSRNVHYTTEDGLIDNSVYAMVTDNSGRTWIGTEGQGLNYLEGKRVRKLDMGGARDVSSVYSILPWNDGVLFVGTAGHGLYMLLLEGNRVKSWRKVVDGIVYSIIRDGDRVIVGTRGQGVWSYDVVSGSLRSMTSEPLTLDVLSMHLDGKGRLWLGTSTGLYSISPEGDINRISEHDTLPNNTVHAILEDADACLWVSTNNGIGRILETEAGYRITSYYTVDGLFSNEFCDGACCSNSGGREFIFGNVGGLTVFDPLSISSSSFLPHLSLESFRINNEERPLADGTLNLESDVDYVSFVFTPVDYLNGHRCKISYRLDGGDRDWIDIGTAGTIVLNRLKRGKHTLYVRCSTPDGEWGAPEFILPIRVHVAWYLSIAAIAVYIIALTALLGLLAWSLFQRLRQKSSMLTRETAHEAKLKFFTDIAHEFSNSLTLIYGPCVQILSNPSVDQNTKRYATLIENSSERMRTLIQELIDFRKAETGHLSLHCNEVELRPLAEREIGYFSEMLAERKVSVSLDMEKTLTSWLTDQDSLEKMVFNLLSNAAKYTPSGESILLHLGVEAGKLHVSVTNYGVGISRDKMDSIFNRFTVLDRYEKDVSRGRRTTSNGIGLAMCHTLAELLGGSISVDSDGSSFVKFEFCLPQMQQEVEEKTAGSGHLSEWHPAPVEDSVAYEQNVAEDEPDARKGPMMLVVDDEQQIRQFIADLFANEFVIVQAKDGKAALEEVRKRRPDIIISDLIMPGMGGVEMLKTLKGNEMTKRIPVILLSSKDTVENQIEGLAEGAVSFLGKPFNPKQLATLVNSILKRDKAIIEYSNSPLQAVDMFEGKVLKKNIKELLTAVTDVVYKNLNNENLTLDMIAEQTAVSKMKLYRAIKESTDLSPTQYIRSVRIEHAEKLLRTTNMTVQEIIYACGFSSKAYFYKVFSERYGTTPKDYRTTSSESRNG